MKELRTEIEIQATPDKVWKVLTSLDKYPEWNPFIHHAIGKAQVSEKVDITFKSGSKEMTLHCTVVKVEPNKELRWKYHVALPFLFNGEHSFIIEQIEGNKVRFIDREIFKGETVLDPMAGTGSTLVAALRAGRNSYGIELNPKYARIAQQVIGEERATLGKRVENLQSELINDDAVNAVNHLIPAINYVLTSPPYWDMLHARGAETQRKRRSASELDVFYSDDPNDIGSIHDYEAFLERLVNIYKGLKPCCARKPISPLSSRT